MPNNSDILLQGRLNGKQRNCLKSLLPMLYKPSELAEEIGINKNQIYMVYIPEGCPHQRDEHNHIWINGEEFKNWYIESYKKHKLKEGEAYCKSCRKPVKMRNPERNETENGLVYDLCNCPNCNRNLTRIITQKRTNHDKSGQLATN